MPVEFDAITGTDTNGNTQTIRLYRGGRFYHASVDGSRLSPRHFSQIEDAYAFAHYVLSC